MRKWPEQVKCFLDAHSFGVAVVAALVVIALGAGFTAWKWEELHGDSPGTNASTTLRNMGLLIAGGLAIVFAAWRGWVAERQSATARRQADTAQVQSDIAHQELLYDRYQRGAQMLGHEIIEMRLAGIYALEWLAKEDLEQYDEQIMKLFCAFIRNHTEDRESYRKRMKSWSPSTPLCPEDVQAALAAIRDRCRVCKTEISPLFFTVDLSGSFLDGCVLSNVNLSDVNLYGASLNVCDLSGSILNGANLKNAHLSRATLTRCKFNGMTMEKTDFSCVSGDGVNFPGVFFWESDFSGATWTNVNFKGATFAGCNFKESSLTGADITGAYFHTDSKEIGAQSEKYGLTQGQLDEACSDPLNPPQLNGLLDAETHEPLVWRGRSIEA